MPEQDEMTTAGERKKNALTEAHEGKKIEQEKKTRGDRLNP